jgi:hypothetical protein
MKNIIFTLCTLWACFAHAQSVQTAPYLQTFDNDTTPTFWTNPVNIVFGTPIYWYSANNTSSNPSAYAPAGLAATAGDHTGNSGYYMYAYRGWNTNLELTSPEIDVSNLTTPALSFWVFAHTTSAQNNTLNIDVYDGTWHLSASTISQSSSSWQNHVVNLSGYASDTLKVRFRRGNTVNSNQDILIDDVKFDELPTCLPPTALAVDSVNASLAIINISGQTSNVWEYEYGNTGFAIGTGTRDTTSQSQINISNLNANTNYILYMRNKCSLTDTSVWIQTNFQTTCGVFSAPFTETFDTTTTPNCWGNYSTVIPNYLVGFSTNEDHTGNNGASANWDFFAATPVLHLESPQIDISALAQPYLTFYRKAYEANAHPNNFDGSVTAEAFDGTNWIALKSLNYNDPNWQFNAIDLQGLSLPDTTKFRLKYELSGTYVTDDYIDDFTIGEMPTCLPTDSMYVNNISAGAVSLKFTGSTSRQVEWGVKGFLRGSGNYVSTNSTSALLLGTQPNTAYTAYYRDSCASGFSEWSEPVHFETSCLSVFTAPYLQTFNNLPTQDTMFSSTCWTTYRVGKTNWVADNGTPSGSTGPSVLHDGAFAYTEATDGDTADISFLESPLVDLSSVNNPYLSFYYHMFGNTMGDLCVEVYNGTTWQPLGNCLVGQQQTSGTSPWLRKTISLNSFANSTIKVRFKGVRGTGFASDMAIDDVLFMDSCTVPKPVAGFTYNLDSLNFAGYYVSFNSSASGANSTSWDFGDGNTDTGSFVQHIYTTNGTFMVLQTVANSCGQIDTISNMVVINGVSIKEDLLPKQIKLFPNPVNSSLTIQADNDKIQNIRIYNLLGQELLNTAGIGQTIVDLDVSFLSSGVYIIAVDTENGRWLERVKKE